MYKLLLVICFSLAFLLLGCQKDISEEEFLINSNFESIVIDVEFKDAESHDIFSASYDPQNLEFDIVDYSMLINKIEDYEYFEPNPDFNLPFESNSKKSYLLIPVYGTWIIQDINSTYAFSNGDLTINISVQSSPYPTTSIKLFIIEIESEYDYNVNISLNE